MMTKRRSSLIELITCSDDDAVLSQLSRAKIQKKCNLEEPQKQLHIWIILTLLEKILILTLSRMTLSKITLLKVYEQIDILIAPIYQRDILLHILQIAMLNLTIFFTISSAQHCGWTCFSTLQLNYVQKKSYITKSSKKTMN